MNQQYDVDYFIKKFEKIPEELIVPGVFDDGKGGHCANGWCGAQDSRPEGKALQKIFSPLALHYKYTVFSTIIVVVDVDAYSNKAAAVNNGSTLEYQQPTPKQRILAALYDIKAMQIPIPTPPKERIVYVAVSEDIREEVKEQEFVLS